MYQLIQLGVKAVDANTLKDRSKRLLTYLPSMMLYNALQREALEAHGGLYNSDVAGSSVRSCSDGAKASAWCMK